MAVLPMFPLGSVLFPGGVLPLHVFEPRYRALVQDCLTQEDPEFGVTLIERGSEVGGGDVRTTVGTVARIVEVGAMEDGRYALLTVGIRRIRVNAWLPDDPYPLADVDDWPDDDPDDPDALQGRVPSLFATVRRLHALRAELDEGAALPDVDLADEPVLASYHLATLAPIGPADDLRLLRAGGPAERLDLLAELLADEEEVLRFRLGGSDTG
jgi:Lon protease-like protein